MQRKLTTIKAAGTNELLMLNRAVAAIAFLNLFISKFSFYTGKARRAG